MIEILIEKTNFGINYPLPLKATRLSSGFDLIAAINSEEYLKKNEVKLIPSGIKLKIPIGYEGQIRSRSGLALKHGIIILNSPGTIDADYRGEIGILLINLGDKTFRIFPGMKIAQLIISSLPKCYFKEGIIKIDKKGRNEDGFGSTGY